MCVCQCVCFTESLGELERSECLYVMVNSDSEKSEVSLFTSLLFFLHHFLCAIFYSPERLFHTQICLWKVVAQMFSALDMCE